MLRDQDRSDRRILQTCCRWITWAYLCAIAVLGLTPSASLGSIYVFSREMNTQQTQSFSLYTSICFLSIYVLIFLWKSNIARQLRMSWPFFLVVSGYFLIMILLISDEVRDYIYEIVKYGAPLWLHEMAVSMDVSHSVMYLTLTVFALTGWRGRVAPFFIAILLCGYGLFIEIAQEFVPTRSFQIADLISNCAGVLVASLAASLAGASPRGQARPSHPQQGGMP